jgi:hypothetical protein
MAEEITIKVRTTTASTIRQRYWMVSGLHKLDALSRILEAEEFDAWILGSLLQMTALMVHDNKFIRKVENSNCNITCC